MDYALYTLLALAIAMILFVTIVALRPNEFTVARSGTILASPDEVFPHVNNLQAFLKWSPYEERDPDAKRTFEGPPAGVGSIYRFSGNDNFGEGSIEIIETKAPEVIRMKLDFIRPFCGNNQVVYTFEPVGDQTVVTWNLIGKYNFFTKAMGLFISMDQMIGSDFERGLAKMKTIVESEPAATPAKVSASS